MCVPIRDTLPPTLADLNFRVVMAGMGDLGEGAHHQLLQTLLGEQRRT